MDESRQFTLRYLFLELFCIAATLASYRVLAPLLLDGHPAACPLAYLSAALTGISVGGLFRRMQAGAVAGLADDGCAHDSGRHRGHWWAASREAKASGRK